MNTDMNFEFRRMRGISWLFEKLLIYQEELCSTDLFSCLVVLFGCTVVSVVRLFSCSVVRLFSC